MKQREGVGVPKGQLCLALLLRVKVQVDDFQVLGWNEDDQCQKEDVIMVQSSLELLKLKVGLMRRHKHKTPEGQIDRSRVFEKLLKITWER